MKYRMSLSDPLNPKFTLNDKLFSEVPVIFCLQNTKHEGSECSRECRWGTWLGATMPFIDQTGS